jgi:putative acetyltransferase
MSITVRTTAPDHPAAQVLLAQLDRYLAERYPAEANHIDSLEELKKPNVVFVVAWEGSNALGCGAIKFLRDEVNYGEIKRVFVAQHSRRKGIADILMQHLEQSAIDRGIGVLRLEAGMQQPEAIALYKKLGFTERDVFSGYENANIALSVFMEKRLV